MIWILADLNIVLLIGNVMAMLSIPLLQPAMYSLHSSLAPQSRPSRVFLDIGASFTIIITCVSQLRG